MKEVEIEVVVRELASMATSLQALAKRISGANAPPPSESTPPVVKAPVGLLARAIWLRDSRRARDRAFATMPDLFCDPGYDIMLLLFIDEEKNRRVSISAAATAGDTPATTGLRWIHLLEKRNMIVRTRDPDDARRSYLTLSPLSRAMMIAYLAQLQL